MSRYLFESPHCEESNYFSTTHHNDEKPFLLVLAMLVTNVDLSTDPNEKDDGPLLNDKPSTSYKVTEDEMIDTFTLLFEGQTRKFSSFNFLIGLVYSTKDATEESQGAQKRSIVDIVEDFCFDDVSLKQLNEELIHNNNHLQFAGDYDFTKAEERKFKKSLEKVKK
jgi:hypothetical protein